MSDIFQGWRRKFGLTTLLLALVFMSGWVRSLNTGDHLSFPPEVRKTTSTSIIHLDELYSASGLMMWGRSFEESTDEINPNELRSRLAYPFWVTVSPTTNLDDPQLKWRWRWCGFGICEYNDQRVVGVWESILVVPYWMITIPLTLISAFLILPRSRKPTERTKEGPNEALPQTK